MTAQKSLLIIGAGKFSTEIEELARLNGYTDIAFLDDKLSKWSTPVIGTIADLAALRSRFASAMYVANGFSWCSNDYLLMTTYEEMRDKAAEMPIVSYDGFDAFGLELLQVLQKYQASPVINVK